MRLVAGDKLGQYEIVSLLGAGGMGEVYRARDRRLNRDVAIKTVSAGFAEDRDHMARFELEARILAALNHPNIAAIYGLEEQAIVMELVEGPTLSERIAAGPIPLDDVLSIAHQIIGALEAAHERGIVHRDLKPANVKISLEGRVKVLDFGLAKPIQAERAATSAASAPTLVRDATASGIVLGTAGYMSPEQVRGKPAEKRADIWSFGVVLYEMVTLTRLFERDSLFDTLAAVLNDEPKWDRVPRPLQRLLRSCLERDPQRRLRDIGDARLLLEELPEVVERRRPSRVPWAIAALFALSALAAAMQSWWPGRTQQPADRPLIRLSVDLGREAVAGSMITAAISSDGTRVVYPWAGDGKQMLAVRRLHEATATPLPGTEGGSNPFFSPEGEWLGFLSGSELKKILFHGGAPVRLATISNPRGASWSMDGSIVAPLSNQTGLSRIPSGGGTSQPLTELEPDELSHRWPQVLPGGRAVIFTGRSPSLNSYENASIDVVTLETRARKTLWKGGYFGRYLPSRGRRGHLVFIHEGVLFGVPFDPDRLEIGGTPVPIVDDIASDPVSGGGQFDFSATGTLVYLSGPGTRSWQLAWVDAAGNHEPILAKRGMYYSPRFSPDGHKVAVSIETGNGSDIFVYDLAQQSTARLSFTPQQGNFEPTWTPDGKYIVYRSLRPAALWWVRSDGGGEPQQLRLAAGGGIQATSFSPDGKRLAFQERNPSTSVDVLILPLDLSDPDHPKPGNPQAVVATPGIDQYAVFSPDGRWIAYQSDESGSTEIYVRRVSDPGGKWQVSNGGGGMPQWSRTRPEIFYQTGNRIMAAEYEANTDSFAARKPRLWSPAPVLAPGYVNFDLAPDGKRFAVLVDPENRADGQSSVHVTFLLNFFDELNRRAPSK